MFESVAAISPMVAKTPVFMLTVGADITEPWIRKIGQQGIAVPARLPFPSIWVELSGEKTGVLLQEGDPSARTITAEVWRPYERSDIGVAYMTIQILANDDWSIPAPSGEIRLPQSTLTSAGTAVFKTPEGAAFAASAYGAAHLGLMCAALTHLKNMTVEERPIARSQRRRLARILGADAPTTVRTLNIIPFSTEPRGTRHQSTEPAPVPFHLVRGHFSRYSESKPLFGRYVGNFWIPAHARGNKAFGTIDHHYDVKLFDDGE